MKKWIVSLIFGVMASASAAENSLITLDGQLLQGSLIRGTTSPGNKVLLNGEMLEVSESGDFVFGFSRDEDQSFTLKATNGTSEETITLTPEAREYRIQRIDGLEQNKVTPPESVLSRIRSDAALVRKARKGTSAYTGFKQTFIWPSEGRITGIYGSQRILNGKPSRPHFGIDLAAPTGTTVVAPAKGRITMAHPDLYYSGGTMIIDHGLGVFSTFLHMNTFDVAEGDWVEQGDKIGEVGSTGRSTGPHLDWRINWESVRLDPALLVPAREGLDYTSAED